MRNQAMQMKNATVAMLLVCPMLFLILGFAVGAGSSDKEPEAPPPILMLTEASGYTFESGSAALSSDLSVALTNTVVQTIADLAQLYRCDIVEVIGHTDGQRVSTISNLDDSLTTALAGKGSVTLSPGSNADLGLMRAWSVAHFLSLQPALSNLRFYGYSAGQGIGPDGTLASTKDFTDRSESRRIEIRIRRSVQVIGTESKDD
jgi:outer membrane protein OmpA-like peptidoglycan-associated protein